MIKLKEAESDYVKIGNMILPKNAADMGYADYATVARKAKKNYEAEKEAERKEKEQAAYREKGKKFYDKFIEIYNAKKDSDIDDTMAALFDEFVPFSGACETLGAEFIRAIERIRYRSYNDGDRFYEGYGLETAGSDAAFIADYASELEPMIENIVKQDYISDKDYNNALNKLAESVVEYLKNNPELFGKPVVDSRDYDSDRVEDWEERSHHYEFEPYMDDRLDSFLDRGCIDKRDIEDFLWDLTQSYGGEVYSGYITGLTSDEYDEWERRFGSEFDYWMQELTDEYGDGYEDDEDDED